MPRILSSGFLIETENLQNEMDLPLSGRINIRFYSFRMAEVFFLMERIQFLFWLSSLLLAFSFPYPLFL